MKRQHSACNIAPSSAAKVLFGSKADSIRARTIWEKVKTKDQCTAVLKDEAKVCWLCGNPVDPTLPNTDPLSIQCEHVLPVMQAVIFLQLYSREHQDNITEAIKLEYAWSHAVCNRIKTNSVFILETDDGNYSVNTPEIQRVLTEIQKNTPVANNQSVNVVSKIQLIVDYLNREPGSANLKLLAGVIDCLEDITPTAKRRLSLGGKRKRNSKLKRTRRHKRK